MKKKRPECKQKVLWQSCSMEKERHYSSEELLFGHFLFFLGGGDVATCNFLQQRQMMHHSV